MVPIKVLICTPGADAAPWLRGLREALPQLPIDDWRPGAPPADVALVWMPPQRMLDEQPSLRALVNLGAGVDGLLRLQLPPGVPVYRLRDAGMAVQMAEYVLDAVVRFHRGLDALDAAQHDARWAWTPPASRSACTVGLLGVGAMGARVARALQALDYPVLAWSRSGRVPSGVRGFAGADGLPQLLAQSRVLVNLLPLTPDTADLLNHANLGRLPAGALLVNVGRGAHLVEADLLALLDQGHLAGAVLDVFRTEPLPPEHPFWRHPRIRVTPHVAAQTLLGPSVAQVADLLRTLQAGDQPAGAVDVLAGY